MGSKARQFANLLGADGKIPLTRFADELDNIGLVSIPEQRGLSYTDVLDVSGLPKISLEILATAAAQTSSVIFDILTTVDDDGYYVGDINQTDLAVNEPRRFGMSSQDALEYYSWSAGGSVSETVATRSQALLNRVVAAHAADPDGGYDAFFTTTGRAADTPLISADSDGNISLVNDLTVSNNLAVTGNADFNSTEYMKVPVGTTEQRPSSPAVGHLRYNTSFGRLEQYTGDGWVAIDTPPTITSLAYSGGLLGADPAGGETITLTGTNFQSGANVTFGGTAAGSVTVNSSTSITATTPAKTAGDYDVVVTNANGLAATLQNGISYNGLPAFTTPAGQIGNDLAPNTTISTITIVAAEPDGGSLSYSITSGAVPTGLVLDSDGTIDGTTPDLSSTTTYNFTVTATDDENQTNSRAFNLVVLRKIYAYNIPQSLMFNDDDSQYLTWTPESAGNRKTWTWSGWVKRGNLGLVSDAVLFCAGSDDANKTLIRINTSEQLRYVHFDASSATDDVVTSQVFRDLSSWYHIVVAVDTTDGTESNRVKMYVNGVEVTSFATSNYPTSSFDTDISATHTHRIGQNVTTSQNFDGYLTEINFIDGQALTPTSFGETYNDVWIPKAYDGSYGTNGFYLPMTNDTSVEAFNTVTWYGDGTVSKDINGVGFEPDFVWIKERTSTSSHHVYDQVRGIPNALYPESNTGESTSGSQITSFNSDGFTIDGGGGINQDGQNYVAWCWKAGDSNVSNTDGSITTTIRANQTYGFSILTWVATDDVATLGHGLGVAPDMVIFKNRDAQESWIVYHSGIPNEFFRLEANNAGSAAGSSLFNSQQPTSSVIHVGGDNATNGAAGADFVAYAWAETAGYSAFGTYQGTDDTNGPTITTGFRPAFILIKCVTLNESWSIIDNTRDTVSPHTKYLLADVSNVEGDTSANGIQFTDTGFKLVGGDDRINGSAGGAQTYIYAAFADTRDNAFWRDESGNNNDWQPVNTGAYRVTTDTPTE
jgi:hypothetical protein